jgi:hypothetical protein
MSSRGSGAGVSSSKQGDGSNAPFSYSLIQSRFLRLVLSIVRSALSGLAENFLRITSLIAALAFSLLEASNSSSAPTKSTRSSAKMARVKARLSSISGLIAADAGSKIHVDGTLVAETSPRQCNNSTSLAFTKTPRFSTSALSPLSHRRGWHGDFVRHGRAKAQEFLSRIGASGSRRAHERAAHGRKTTRRNRPRPRPQRPRSHSRRAHRLSLATRRRPPPRSRRKTPRRRCRYSLHFPPPRRSPSHRRPRHRPPRPRLHWYFP